MSVFRRFVLLATTTLALLLLLASGSQPARAKTWPGPAPKAAKGYVYVCKWLDGSPPKCEEVKLKKPVKTVKKTFENCQQAEDWIRANTVGEMAPKFRGVRGRVTYHTNADGKFTASTTVDFKFDDRTSVLTVTSLSWPRMTGSEQGAVNTFNDALLNHEAGHALVGQATAAGFTGRLESDPAPSKAAALRSLQRELNERQDQAQRKLDQVAGDGGDYDTATGHGRSQSSGSQSGFPGGPNVSLVCPPACASPNCLPSRCCLTSTGASLCLTPEKTCCGKYFCIENGKCCNGTCVPKGEVCCNRENATFPYSCPARLPTCRPNGHCE
jgi:hypothetical protein